MLASRLPVLSAALIAQTLTACALIEPASPDGQVPEYDAGTRAYDESEAEGLSDLLETAESPLAPDAATPASPVPVQVAADGGPDGSADAQAECEADWQCAPSEVCSRVRRACSPRCEGQACLGPTISDTNDHLVSDGARVCFADDSEAPGSGDFALRIWDGVAPRATTLTRARDVRALLLDAQYCYFHAAGALRRAALTGGCVELLQEMPASPPRIWSDGALVSWSAADGHYRVAPQQNARIERVESDAGVPSGEIVSSKSALAGERMIERNAAEGRLQAIPAMNGEGSR